MGSDTLKLTGNGGTGNDTFVFNTALNAATNVDTIVDFWWSMTPSAGECNLHWAGCRDTGGYCFPHRFGRRRRRRPHHLQQHTGALRFDSDGTGANAAIQFATWATGLSLNNNDFVVV